MDKATPAPIMTTDTDKLVEMLRASGAETCNSAGTLFMVSLKDAVAFRDRIIASLCGDVEPFVFEEYPYNSEAMGCGLEDRDITDRYEAMAYGWDRAM